MLQLLQKATEVPDRIAIIDQGKSSTYYDLLEASEKVALQLLKGHNDLKEARIGFMIRPGFDYVATQWGIWRAGGIAVPICVSYPVPSIEYLIEDCGISQLISATEFMALLAPLASDNNIPLAEISSIAKGAGRLPDIDAERRAMILYTSGTTGKPKGVVSTHQNIEAQVGALVTAWQWQADDHILNILPLHHVHGIVNVLSCALWSGACCEFLPAFDAKEVFHVFNRGAVNLFMAVPTIYYKLINYWEKLPPDEQKEISQSLQKFRLMVSGSAALPVSVLEKWRKISGHTLLERYGMTEMGMAISNPYKGERRPGYIGQPLPNVTVRLVDEENKPVSARDSGEIQVKGPNVFSEYWNKPEATREAFTDDGWFKTGDIAAFEKGSYRILGRNSVDIIKSGGYKISALEIEEVLRKHPAIKDCGVVGIPNEEWGEIVGASLILAKEGLDLQELDLWIRERMPAYKIPRKYIIQDDLPRNVMGKVTKVELKRAFGD